MHLTLSHLHSCCFVQLLMDHPIWVHLGLLRYYHSFFLPTGSSNSNCTHLWENYILWKLIKYKQALKNIISFVWNHLWFALILERGFVWGVGVQGVTYFLTGHTVQHLNVSWFCLGALLFSLNLIKIPPPSTDWKTFSN